MKSPSPRRRPDRLSRIAGGTGVCFGGLLTVVFIALILDAGPGSEDLQLLAGVGAVLGAVAAVESWRHLTRGKGGWIAAGILAVIVIYVAVIFASLAASS